MVEILLFRSSEHHSSKPAPQDRKAASYAQTASFLQSLDDQSLLSLAADFGARDGGEKMQDIIASCHAELGRRGLTMLHRPRW